MITPDLYSFGFLLSGWIEHAPPARFKFQRCGVARLYTGARMLRQGDALSYGNHHHPVRLLVVACIASNDSFSDNGDDHNLFLCKETMTDVGCHAYRDHSFYKVGTSTEYVRTRAHGGRAMNNLDRGIQLIRKGLERFQGATRFLVDPTLVLASTREETSIVFRGEPTSCVEAGRIWHAFRTSIALDNELSSNILNLRGMSGRKYRRFINRLVNATPDAAYLEIGSWTGSTTCAAIAGNSCRVVCIDNWTLFDGPKTEFEKNITSVLNPRTRFRSIESDFRLIDYRDLGTFNIYLFDGPHEYQDQYDGVMIVQPALAEVYVLIVDDWNWPSVRRGTLAALEALGTDVLYSIEIRTTQTDCRPMQSSQKTDWHNGYFLAACKKKRVSFSSAQSKT
ncbi:MAG: class I SAM-dependent methyltransferase, partial [Silvibacterium sp.]